MYIRMNRATIKKNYFIPNCILINGGNGNRHEDDEGFDNTDVFGS